MRAQFVLEQGMNWKQAIAWLIAIQWDAAFLPLYHYAWFVGFILAFILYLLGRKSRCT